jgi:hypothetical protein
VIGTVVFGPLKIAVRLAGLLVPHLEVPFFIPDMTSSQEPSVTGGTTAVAGCD